VLDQNGSRYLTLIATNAKRMQKMVQDILSFSRVGREDVKVEPVDCKQLVEEVVAEFASAIAEKNARIQCGDLPTVVTSATLMRILFQNLISNALKFQDGSRPPEITIGSELSERTWQFFVRDNGIGIDPSFHNTLFTIFQRFHRKEEYPGTGIGLSTCRKFINLCGGEISFVSRPGGGTTFFFTLPAQAGTHPGRRDNPAA
jgi:two-component system sensor histidine kinase/response regulator